MILYGRFGRYPRTTTTTNYRLYQVAPGLEYNGYIATSSVNLYT